MQASREVSFLARAAPRSGQHRNTLMAHWRRISRRCGFAALPVAAFVAGTNAWVACRGSVAERASLAELAPAPVAIVLGASVKADGTPSHALEDRLAQALELYQSRKAARLLLSGDHGRADYDETNTMRRWLVERGVAPEDLFCDHAGFSTYDTMARAKRVFAVERALVVTQDFHLPRALYTARALGIAAEGTPCDRRTYARGAWFALREVGSRTNAFLEAGLFRPDPLVLGAPIPITGDGRASWDERP